MDSPDNVCTATPAEDAQELTELPLAYIWTLVEFSTRIPIRRPQLGADRIRNTSTSSANSSARGSITEK